MKRITYFLFALFLVPNLAFGQDAWSDKTRVLPDKLRKVPEMLFITHNPNPNYPEENTNFSKSDTKYVWKHKTIICSPRMDLTVIEAGSFIWYDESGWKPNVNYSKKDFSKRFNCPKGYMEIGSCYTFEENYRYGNNLYGGDALWYVLAEDSEGNIYKGIGLIETESELLNKKP